MLSLKIILFSVTMLASFCLNQAPVRADVFASKNIVAANENGVSESLYGKKEKSGFCKSAGCKILIGFVVAGIITGVVLALAKDAGEDTADAIVGPLMP